MNPHPLIAGAAGRSSPQCGVGGWRTCWSPRLATDGDALELAQLASSALSRDTSGAGGRAGLLIQQMRSKLQLPAPRFEPVVGLTRRELEVARFAARGTFDREVAERLFLSVRQVESHLTSTYRKLGITSRRELRDILAGMV